MEDGRHVMLAGEGALIFAREIGFPECAPASLIVDSERLRWESKHGTVGCVALDNAGTLAVATSTGGIFNKLPGRVGDSPLIGCGTYADDTWRCVVHRARRSDYPRGDGENRLLIF